MSQQKRSGRFITFEGIDGAGKSTHIDSAVSLIREHGISVVSTREPGGTSLGEKLRMLLLHEPMHCETETLLMFAARREHLALVIEPALARGEWVVCDRFSDATYAYQGGGRGLEKSKFSTLEQWVHGHLQPDLTFLFDLSPTVASNRLSAQGRELDKFEQERADFHHRVRAAYLERADQSRGRIRILDANRPPESIKKEIEEIVSTFCL